MEQDRVVSLHFVETLPNNRGIDLLEMFFLNYCKAIFYYYERDRERQNSTSRTPVTSSNQDQSNIKHLLASSFRCLHG